MIIREEDVVQDGLKVVDASGEEVTELVFVNKPEGINTDETAPTLESMVVTPVSSDAALKIEDGTLVTYGKNQKYFRFDEEKIRALYNVTQIGRAHV